MHVGPESSAHRAVRRVTAPYDGARGTRLRDRVGTVTGRRSASHPQAAFDAAPKGALLPPITRGRAYLNGLHRLL